MNRMWVYPESPVVVALLALLAPLGPGCSDPAADKPQAQVAPASGSQTADARTAGAQRAEGVTPAAATPGAPAILLLGPDRSRIGFIGSKVTGSHTGEFKQWSGEIRLPADGSIEAGSVRIEIDMTSVETDTPRLTSHLKTGDFFLVEQHPTAVFVSTSVEPDGSGENLYRVTGDLSLRGVTRSVSFPATITRTADTLSVESEFALDRKEFGILYPGKPDDLIRDDVVIQLALITSA